MKNSLLIFTICLSITGCAGIITPSTPIGKFTLSDAENASKLAKADGSPAALHRAQCYDYIANQVQSAANSIVPGLLTLNEEKYQAINSAMSFGTACGGVLPMAISL